MELEQVEIQLGHLCNNRCVFCSSGFITGMKLVGQEDPDMAMSHLADARRQGARKVTFVGGEPTLQRDFPAIVQRARELGYDEIVVFTNGVRTQQREYLEELLKNGPLTFRISIQGGTRAAHDRVTGRLGSFQRILDGMRLMNELGQKIQCNACLNVHNYKSVEGYPALAREHGIHEVHLDQVNPLEIGNRPPGYISTILVRYSEQAPYLARMLTEFERTLGPDYDVHLGNIPFCVLPQWAHRIHHAGSHTQVVSANLDGPYHAAHDKYARKTEHKQKPESCANCAFNPICSGAFDEYVEMFGTAELAPVSVDQLRDLPNAPQLFSLLERSALERLAFAEPPPAVRLTRVEIGARDSEARFSYALGEDTLEVIVRHPSAPGAAVAVSERFALFVSASRIDERVQALVSWAFARLLDGEQVVLEPHEPELERRIHWGAVSREQLARMFDALHSRTSIGRFRLRSCRMSRDGESATLLVDDGEFSSRIRLVTQRAFEKPRVRALLPRDPDLAREIGQALRTELAMASAR